MSHVTKCAWVFVLAGCASSPSYIEQVLSRPLPVSEQAKRDECTLIRSEIARMQNIAAVGATPLWQAAARNNIAALESRAATVGCTAAFSSTPPAPAASSRIDECVQACRKYTPKTAEQCFEGCR